MTKSIVIAIDVWPDIYPKFIDRMVNRINSMDNIEAVLFATYSRNGSVESRLDDQGYHPTIRQRLNKFSDELIPYTYKAGRYRSNYWKQGQVTRDIVFDILRIEKKYDFDSIIMMGGQWDRCVHHRSYGIRNLKLVLPHKKIIVYPDCMKY
jgi:hypothetical protein